MMALRRLGAQGIKATRLLVGLTLSLPIRVIAPLYRIEIQRIWAERMGHFALEPELYICTHRIAMRRRSRTFFYCETPVANSFLLSHWQRVLPMGPVWLLKLLFEASDHFPWLDLRARDWSEDHRDLRVLDAFPPSLMFTADEEERGLRLLGDLGVPPDTPYVCLAVRDSAYLEATAPHRDWSYHDYRDSDIETYVQMCEALAEAGYAVLRMGAIVKQPLVSPHPLVIDYATSGLRSDFGDVYLFAKCSFCITTSTGMDALAMIFRRPMGAVNLPVAGALQLGESLRLVMFKDMLDAESGALLTLSDPRRAMAMRLSRTHAFADVGVDLRDNTSEELVAFAREMVAIQSSGLDLEPEACQVSRALVRQLTDEEFANQAKFMISPSWLRSRRCT